MQNIAYPSQKEETLLDFERPREFSTTDLPAAKPGSEHAPPRENPADGGNRHHREVEDKVKEAEKELEALQQRRERLERQRAELQQLSVRRHSFTQGKNQVVKILTEALPELREEAEEAQRRSEFLRQMREVFGQHLEVLKTVNPEEWDEDATKVELDRGEAVLAEARSEIERFEERVSHFGAGTGSGSGIHRSTEVEFARWMKMGFAFALPAMIFTAFTLVVTYLIITQ